MSTTAFHCENCGAALSVSAAAEFLSCVYCGCWWHLPSQPKIPDSTPSVSCVTSHAKMSQEDEVPHYTGYFLNWVWLAVLALASFFLVILSDPK
jgi:hypothetical protein